MPAWKLANSGIYDCRSLNGVTLRGMWAGLACTAAGQPGNLIALLGFVVLHVQSCQLSMIGIVLYHCLILVVFGNNELYLYAAVKF